MGFAKQKPHEGTVTGVDGGIHKMPRDAAVAAGDGGAVSGENGEIAE
jgi:hypothetical protein